jgi:hypothetical protein
MLAENRGLDQKVEGQVSNGTVMSQIMKAEDANTGERAFAAEVNFFLDKV